MVSTGSQRREKATYSDPHEGKDGNVNYKQRASGIYVPDRRICDMRQRARMGGGSNSLVTKAAAVALESYTDAMDGTGWTDLGGAGGDATTKCSDGSLGVTGDPLHWVLDQALPASGNYDLTIKTQCVTTFLLGINIHVNHGARRLARYGSGGGNPTSGDAAAIILINHTKVGPFSGLTNDMIEFQQNLDASYSTSIANLAGESLANDGECTWVFRVRDASGVPKANVELTCSGLDTLSNGEQIAETSFGSNANGYGNRISFYTDGSGGGTTPSAAELINEISWVEVSV